MLPWSCTGWSMRSSNPRTRGGRSVLVRADNLDRIPGLDPGGLGRGVVRLLAVVAAHDDVFRRLALAFRLLRLAAGQQLGRLHPRGGFRQALFDIGEFGLN